jgi:hypothetical protein
MTRLARRSRKFFPVAQLLRDSMPIDEDGSLNMEVRRDGDAKTAIVDHPQEKRNSVRTCDPRRHAENGRKEWSPTAGGKSPSENLDRRKRGPMRLHQPENEDVMPSSPDRGEELVTGLELRSLKVRAYVERITGNNSRVEKREDVHIIRGKLPGRTFEVQVTESTYKLLGMRGAIATRLKKYLDLHLSPESPYNY